MLQEDERHADPSEIKRMKALVEKLEEISRLGGIMSTIHWDQEVIMPSGAAVKLNLRRKRNLAKFRGATLRRAYRNQVCSASASKAWSVGRVDGKALPLPLSTI